MPPLTAQAPTRAVLSARSQQAAVSSKRGPGSVAGSVAMSNFSGASSVASQGSAYQAFKASGGTREQWRAKMKEEKQKKAQAAAVQKAVQVASDDLKVKDYDRMKGKYEELCQDMEAMRSAHRSEKNRITRNNDWLKHCVGMLAQIAKDNGVDKEEYEKFNKAKPPSDWDALAP